MYHEEALTSLVCRGRSPDHPILIVSEPEGLPMRVLSAHNHGCSEARFSSIPSTGDQVGRE
jgi:hypothetical protein